MMRYFTIILLCLFNALAVQAEDEVLTLEEFVQLATTRDTEFERILIDELDLAYQHDLLLPSKDLVLSVKQEHVWFLDESRGDPATTIGLSKLFPFSGTELGATYSVRPSSSAESETSPSEWSISVAQPLARNAFGRSTRLLDDIVDIRVDVARHQIVEAYEDYLSTVMVAYYAWWAAHENLKIGQSSYDQNRKLLDNILEREKQQIALPVDVNKTRLQVLSKRENLIELAETYTNRLNMISRMIRHDGSDQLVPQEGAPLIELGGSFEEAFSHFETNSRTFSILALLEERSALNVEREADDLLPSIDLLFGIETSGDDYGVEDSESMAFAGLRLEWPFPDQVDRAEHEIAKIDVERSKLETMNTRYRLYTLLKNIRLQLERELELRSIAEEGIRLSQSVLDDESENYSYGKITLNDYIQAVNALDNQRFSRLRHDQQVKILIVEWLRLTDQLVSREEIASRQK